MCVRNSGLIYDGPQVQSKITNLQRKHKSMQPFKHRRAQQHNKSQTNIAIWKAIQKAQRLKQLIRKLSCIQNLTF